MQSIIEVCAGATLSLAFGLCATSRDGAEVPVDLTGSTVLVFFETTGSALKKTATVLGHASAGVVEIALTPAETRTLKPGGMVEVERRIGGQQESFGICQMRISHGPNDD